MKRTELKRTPFKQKPPKKKDPNKVWNDVQEYPCFGLYFDKHIDEWVYEEANEVKEGWNPSVVSAHHFIEQNWEKRHPVEYAEIAPFLQKMIFIKPSVHLDLHKMTEERCFDTFGIKKHQLMFDYNRYLSGGYDV